jgi:hypothetical protein
VDTTGLELYLETGVGVTTSAPAGAAALMFACYVLYCKLKYIHIRVLRFVFVKEFYCSVR